MIRKRTFNLVAKTNVSSWNSFDEAFEYLKNKKHEIENTFALATFDYNFNEPMNAIIIECDPKNIIANNIKMYAEKINNLFENNNDKIVIDIRLSDFPANRKQSIRIEHTYFIKMCY
jgi:hypothetical protein